MKHRELTSRLLFIAMLLFLFASCGGSGSNRNIKGRIISGESGVEAAKVEVYLEAGRFGKTSPFAVTFTDEEGGFNFSLPEGLYYLVARAESPEGGRLFGEFSANPVDLKTHRERIEVIITLEPSDFSGNYRGPSDSGIRGRVVNENGASAGGYVYVYESGSGELMGPGYLTAEAVDEQGLYRTSLHPGRYWVVARRKAGGEKAGFMGMGDLTGPYPLNPVEVKRGSFTDLDDIILHPADPGRLAEIKESRNRRSAETGLSGIVRDSDGDTAAGLYVILYEHPQMIGRPLALSVSDEQGRFVLSIPRGGQYYLGARENRSGPRNPGEMAGGYEGTPDHSIILADGEWHSGIVVKVEEVW